MKKFMKNDNNLKSVQKKILDELESIFTKDGKGQIEEVEIEKIENTLKELETRKDYRKICDLFSIVKEPVSKKFDKKVANLILKEFEKHKVQQIMFQGIFQGIFQRMSLQMSVEVFEKVLSQIFEQKQEANPQELQNYRVMLAQMSKDTFERMQQQILESSGQDKGLRLEILNDYSTIFEQDRSVFEQMFKPMFEGVLKKLFSQMFVQMKGKRYQGFNKDITSDTLPDLLRDLFKKVNFQMFRKGQDTSPQEVSNDDDIYKAYGTLFDKVFKQMESDKVFEQIFEKMLEHKEKESFKESSKAKIKTGAAIGVQKLKSMFEQNGKENKNQVQSSKLRNPKSMNTSKEESIKVQTQSAEPVVDDVSPRTPVRDERTAKIGARINAKFHNLYPKEKESSEVQTPSSTLLNPRQILVTKSFQNNLRGGSRGV